MNQARILVADDVSESGLAPLRTAGFDLLYSLQDLAFDQENALNSIPACFGPKATVLISRVCFAAMIGLLTV